MTKALASEPQASVAGDARPVLWIVTRDLGVGSQIWMMRQILALRRFRPVVVTWADHRPPEEVAQSGFAVHILPFAPDLAVGRNRWWNRLTRLARGNFYATGGSERRHLLALAQADRPAAILAHFGHSGLRLLPVAQALGIALICHFHGLDLSSSLGNRWYRWSLLRHIRAFGAVITVGTRQRAWVAQHYHRAAGLHLIPCGVPVDAFSRSPAEAALPPPAPPVFAVVSRLVAQKGVDWCLRALALLPRGEMRLQIVGDGPERAALETLSQELGLADEVSFLGAQPPAGVRAVLAGATALLQHSLDAPDGWYEGFGVTVAEASAMALPTIASRCGGLMDQVRDGETGLLVEQRDPEALAQAMRRLAQDAALCRHLGEAARARALAEFDTLAQVDKLENAVFEAMAPKTGPLGNQG
jgi:colanic acid/amylovoran biosynthesis glycosyltransferase